MKIGVTTTTSTIHQGYTTVFFNDMKKEYLKIEDRCHDRRQMPQSRCSILIALKSLNIATKMCLTEVTI